MHYVTEFLYNFNISMDYVPSQIIPRTGTDFLGDVKKWENDDQFMLFSSRNIKSRS